MTKPQSKTLLKKLWKKHITPLDNRSGGGASYFTPTIQTDKGVIETDGYIYLDELSSMPTPTKRGDTFFILHPGITTQNGVPVTDRETGHWTVITTKSRNGLHVVYFDPAIEINGVPDSVDVYLKNCDLPYHIERSSPQTKFSSRSKAFNSCGLFCIQFVKKQFS